MGLSPVPGRSRIFRIADLRKLALRESAPRFLYVGCLFLLASQCAEQGKPHGCHEERSRAQISKIEIVEQSLLPAPEGKIVFPVSGLSGTSDGPVLWRGYVEYAQDRRFMIWARVLITVEQEHVIATAELYSGSADTPGPGESAALLRSCEYRSLYL